MYLAHARVGRGRFCSLVEALLTPKEALLTLTRHVPQFTGGVLILLGFMNQIALNNENSTGMQGLSQPLFAWSIIVLLLGFALERKDPDSDGN